MTIDSLIDKQDTFEIVRDQIGAILALEVENQKTRAEAAGKNPDQWDLRIYSERSNPWEQFLNPGEQVSPLVNVWVDSMNFDESASNLVERQKSETTYNIDCYGYGLSTDNPDGGHLPGDGKASMEAQRAVRLVRNILMAAEYTWLGLRGLVWRRWPQSVTIYQPMQGEYTVQNIVGARLALRVSFNEFSPQVIPAKLLMLSVKINRDEDGLLLLQADYDYSENK